MTRVFVADDHDIVREGLRAWVETVRELTWAGSVGDGDALLERARSEGASWDVLVLDLSLPGRSGHELLREVLALHPALRVIVFSMYPEREYAPWALAAGAQAYIAKSQRLDALRVALLEPHHRGPAAGGPSAAANGARRPHEVLTSREREVFLAIARGLTPSEVGWALSMAPSTVSTHLKAVRQKLGVRSTLEIAQYAARHGIDGAA